MSIQVEGNLQIIRRSGKNGDFTVGELSTHIGKFRIKNSVLDEFEQGSYEGFFLITRVFNVTNTTPTGQVWVSLCADLDWEALRIYNQSEKVESETLETSATIAEITEEAPDETPTDEPATPIHSDDDNLISDATVLQQMLDDGVAEIKLDNTLEDRALFRSLLNAIKETGNYKFSPNGQKWILREQAE